MNLICFQNFSQQCLNFESIRYVNECFQKESHKRFLYEVERLRKGSFPILYLHYISPQCSIAAVTNCNILGDFKITNTYQFTVVLEVQHRSRWAKIGVSKTSFHSIVSRGESVSLHFSSFQRLTALRDQSSLPPSSKPGSLHLQHHSFTDTLLSDFPPLPPYFTDNCCNYNGSSSIVYLQINMLAILIPSANFIFLCHVTQHTSRFHSHLWRQLFLGSPHSSQCFYCFCFKIISYIIITFTSSRNSYEEDIILWLSIL